MKNLILKSLLYTSCAVMAFSCSNDENSPSASDSSVIRFSSEVITTKAPVGGTTFTSGDKVGIYAIQYADPATPAWAVTNFMDNTETTVGSDGKSLSYSPLKEYPATDKLDFYAYYPYSASITAPSTDVAPAIAAILETAAASQVDYMYATPVTGVTKPDPVTAVAFTFKHALSQIKFKVAKDDGIIDDVAVTNLSVTANSVGNMDIATGTWTGLATPVDFAAYADATGVNVDNVTATGTLVGEPLMLFPCAPGALTFKITVQGTSYTFIPSIPVAGLEAGKIYTYTLKYNGSGIVFTTATVTEWVNADVLEPIDITN